MSYEKISLWVLDIFKKYSIKKSKLADSIILNSQNSSHCHQNSGVPEQTAIPFNKKIFQEEQKVFVAMCHIPSCYSKQALVRLLMLNSRKY